jgi:hypothetical protein
MLRVFACTVLLFSVGCIDIELGPLDLSDSCMFGPDGFFTQSNDGVAGRVSFQARMSCWGCPIDRPLMLGASERVVAYPSTLFVLIKSSRPEIFGVGETTLAVDSHGCDIATTEITGIAPGEAHLVACDEDGEEVDHLRVRVSEVVTLEVFHSQEANDEESMRLEVGELGFAGMNARDADDNLLLPGDAPFWSLVDEGVAVFPGGDPPHGAMTVIEGYAVGTTRLNVEVNGIRGGVEVVVVASEEEDGR